MWDKIKDFLGGSASKLITDVGDVVDRFVHTKDEKEKAKQELLKLQHKHEMQAQEFGFMVEQEFNRRVESQEGTATDLKQAGWLGRIVLFLRGVQRPLWGFIVIYWDWKVFAGEWEIVEGSKTELTLFIINFLVLVFLFGERALKNLAPLIERWFKK